MSKRQDEGVRARALSVSLLRFSWTIIIPSLFSLWEEQEDSTIASSPTKGGSASSGSTLSKRSIAGSGRCCFCLENLNRPSPGRQASSSPPASSSGATQSAESVTFCFCNHAYHLSCLRCENSACAYSIMHDHGHDDGTGGGETC